MNCKDCMMIKEQCICSWKKSKHIIVCDITDHNGVRIILVPPYLVEVEGD